MVDRFGGGVVRLAGCLMFLFTMRQTEPEESVIIIEN